jgi:hypothetical protein
MGCAWSTLLACWQRSNFRVKRWLGGGVRKATRQRAHKLGRVACKRERERTGEDSTSRCGCGAVQVCADFGLKIAIKVIQFPQL